MRVLIFLLVAISGLSFGLEEQTPTSRLEELKMKKRFGIGIAAAGGLSVLGIEADVQLW